MQRFSGRRARQAREQLGLTREELAVNIGRSYNTVVSYELGRAIPSGTLLPQYAATLGVEVGDLFEPEAVVA